MSAPKEPHPAAGPPAEAMDPLLSGVVDDPADLAPADPPLEPAAAPPINPSAVLAGLDQQRQVAADRSRSLEERLEAFEDLIDSEVGDTTLACGRSTSSSRAATPPAPRKTASPSPRPWTPCAGASRR